MKRTLAGSALHGGSTDRRRSMCPSRAGQALATAAQLDSAVDGRGGFLGRRTDELNWVDISRMVRATIQQGAALYRAEDGRGCLKLLTSTSESLIEAEKAGLGTPDVASGAGAAEVALASAEARAEALASVVEGPKGPLVTAGVATALRRVRDGDGQQQGMAPMPLQQKCWVLRSALDEMLEELERQELVPALSMGSLPGTAQSIAADGRDEAVASPSLRSAASAGLAEGRFGAAHVTHVTTSLGLGLGEQVTTPKATRSVTRGAGVIEHQAQVALASVTGLATSAGHGACAAVGKAPPQQLRPRPSRRGSGEGPGQAPAPAAVPSRAVAATGFGPSADDSGAARRHGSGARRTSSARGACPSPLLFAPLPVTTELHSSSVPFESSRRPSVAPSDEQIAAAGSLPCRRPSASTATPSGDRPHNAVLLRSPPSDAQGTGAGGAEGVNESHRRDASAHARVVDPPPTRGQTADGANERSLQPPWPRFHMRACRPTSELTEVTTRSPIHSPQSTPPRLRFGLEAEAYTLPFPTFQSAMHRHPPPGETSQNNVSSASLSPTAAGAASYLSSLVQGPPPTMPELGAARLSETAEAGLMGWSQRSMIKVAVEQGAVLV